jgi:uncharacterized membrane protein YphA (DoxX/SURF4 family)
VRDVEAPHIRGMTNTTTTRIKKISYWATTGLSAFALAGIGLADLMRAPQMLAGLAHLGYPAYFATILGAWKLAGVVAILAPGFPRLKEWAYAGFFFTLSGAAMSHASSGDPAGNILFPVVLLGMVATSWALRPAREASNSPQSPAAPNLTAPQQA